MSESKSKIEASESIVRIRGLPWQATKDDIVKFFSDCKIKGGSDGVKMTLSNQGRPSGEAFIEFEDADSYQKALDCHKKHMGSRYIEVFSSDRQQMLTMLQRSGMDTTLEGPDKQYSFVRIRGLPFGSTSEDVIRFFMGMDISWDGIVFAVDSSGRQTGEACIKFSSVSTADKALTKHKEKIGHRYIEVFKSSPQEFRNVKSFALEQSLNGIDRKFSSPIHPVDSYSPKTPNGRWLPLAFNRPSPYDRFSRPSANQRYMSPSSPQVAQSHTNLSCVGSVAPIGASRRPDPTWNLNSSLPSVSSSSRPFGLNHDPASPTFTTTRHLVHMRGLPFKATEGDIKEFFLPLVPSRITILSDDSGRPSGEADVEFYTHGEAEKAMNKDKANMRHRYIELFLHSAPDNIRSRLGPPPPTSSLSISPGHQMLPSFTSDSSCLSGYSLRSLQLQPSQNSSVYFASSLNSASNYLIPNVHSATSNSNNVDYAAGCVYRTHDGILRTRI